MDRTQYLELLSTASIFFSPTLFESFGMGLVEAAAAGAAIVTSSGNGIEHVSELFEDGKDALFVSNDLEIERRVSGYVKAIGMLISDSNLRRMLSFNALELASNGPISLDRNNRDLKEIYEAAILPREACSLRFSPQSSAPAPTLIWSEQTCHWVRQRYTPFGGLRICL